MTGNMDILENMRKMLEAGKISKEDIERAFPELAESEDERIRKAIIGALNDTAVAAYGDTTIGEMLAYLEKQKEQKPLMCDGEIEDRKRDIVAAIRKHYPADYAEYLTSFLKGLSPEDNSEDEYGQEMLGIAYKLMYEHIPENLRTQEFWDSLKFMREYTGKVAIIHSCEQKPAEWSEEDEKMLASFLHKVEVCDLLTNKENVWIVKRLKSLRPKPHWKPSEEQMISLWQASIYYKSGKIKITGEQLESLYDDLKKL